MNLKHVCEGCKLGEIIEAFLPFWPKLGKNCNSRNFDTFGPLWSNGYQIMVGVVYYLLFTNDYNGFWFIFPIK